MVLILMFESLFSNWSLVQDQFFSYMCIVSSVIFLSYTSAGKGTGIEVV